MSGPVATAARRKHCPRCRASHTDRAQRGFSLIELLVALIVVVLLTSLVSFSIGSGGADLRLESEVRNLQDVAAYALDEAQFTGSDFGLLLEEELERAGTVYSYAWRQRTTGPDGWAQPVSAPDVFEPRQFPLGIEVELELEEAAYQTLDNDADDEKREAPQVVFYASGETTVGAINVRRTEDSELLWRIEWDLFGRFKLLPRGIAEEEDEDF
ncbi:MAG: prepilin-type N-terminal cleavage/methylation domain-containing protein [Pseudomonadota bacterium]